MDEKNMEPEVTSTEETVVEETPTRSKKDVFKERISKKNPDLDIEDEDAYYDYVGGLMDERDVYESNTERLRSTLSKSPIMMRLLTAAKDQDNFDPVLYLVENDGLDLEALQSNPEYRDKLAESRANFLKKQTDGEALKKSLEANMPKSIDMVNRVGEEMGLSDEKKEELVGKLYQVMEELIEGRIDEQIFRMLAKGDNFDKAVQDAHEEGQVKGMNTKVDDELRKMDSKSTRVSTRQTPQVQAPQPKKELRNPLRMNGRWD